MFRAYWSMVVVILVLAVVWGSSTPAQAETDQTDHLGTTGIANPLNSTPPVVDWQGEVNLPDDILFVRHTTGGLAPAFLVSLDSAGKVSALRTISGFSLYLNPLRDQVKQFTFSPDLEGKTFVLRLRDPLARYMGNAQLVHTATCSPETDLHTLYELGVHLIHSEEQNEEAARCYKYILDRVPNSVAARYGLAEICMSQKDRCADWYYETLVATNPEFIDARQALAGERAKFEGEAAYVTALDGILNLDISLVERCWLLSQQAFWLDRLDRIDEAIQKMRKWNSAEADLLAIYPQALDYISAMHYGLVEEAKGSYQDAIASYRIASADSTFDRYVPDTARYEIDLGLARTLRKSGHAAEAADLCNQWRTRWRRVVGRPAHHPWELREAGVGEQEGRWEFSCGDPEKGYELLEGAAKEYPDSNEPHTALAEYYYSIGAVEKARAEEATASRLLQEWSDRLGEFN